MRIIGLLVLGLIGLGGCSKSGDSKPIVAVTGNVSLKGKAIAGAMVQFMPLDPNGIPGSGRTDASGNYQLVSAKGSVGVSAGEYKVVISRKLGVDGKEVAEGSSPFTDGVKESLPRIYSDPIDTSLTASVLATGATTVDFVLGGGAMGGAMGGVR